MQSYDRDIIVKTVFINRKTRNPDFESVFEKTKTGTLILVQYSDYAKAQLLIPNKVNDTHIQVIN